MSSQQSPKRNPSDTTMLWGAVLGFVIGAFYALFKLPRSGRLLRDNIARQLTPEDPIERSLTEGKQAARRRQQDNQS